MTLKNANYLSAVQDFNAAHLKASMQEVLARVTGKTNELLSYDEVARKLKLHARSDRGIQDIPLDAIIGSVGRYTDFTRTFLPRNESDRERWARVKAAMADPLGAGPPPIEVYKVGEAYFVQDGNHRVSIARQEGISSIEAHVIEVKSDVPVTPDLRPDNLIIKAEYADFLQTTRIQNLRPNVDLSVTVPGQYRVLLEHIEIHRYFMGLDFQREIPYPEAVAHWYDTVYLSVIEPIRERDLLRWFPDRTETDLYLWVSTHRAMLEEQLKWSVRPEIALKDLALEVSPRAGVEESKTSNWRTGRIYDRYVDRLFNDILVPLDAGMEVWPALEQSLLVARRESASLHGLYIAASKAGPDATPASDIQARFMRRCQEMEVRGEMSIKAGKVADQIVKHARLTDLIVLNVAHPPERGLPGLGSGLRAVIRRATGPLLTVPGVTSQLERALVAFDGSLKSKEALFLATYLAERWNTSLTVMTIPERSTQEPAPLDFARSYLELHEIQADFLEKSGSLETFLEVIRERGIDVMLMGGYSGTVVREVVIGSAVNFMLRNADLPIFICR